METKQTTLYDLHKANLTAIAEAIYFERAFSYIGSPEYKLLTRERALSRLAIMLLNATQ